MVTKVKDRPYFFVIITRLLKDNLCPNTKLRVVPYNIQQCMYCVCIVTNYGVKVHLECQINVKIEVR